MLDSSLCPRTHSQWVSLTSFLSHTFTKAIPVSARIAAIALLLLGMTCLVWMLQQPRRRRKIAGRIRWRSRVTRFVVGLIVLGLLLISPPGVALANQALVSLTPLTSDAKAEAIVVLGRGPKLETDRIEVAAALWRIQRAPRIFVSGHGDAARMLLQLQEKGIPEQALGGEECSMTTGENAKFTVTALKPQGIQKILLVTDPPHMLRSLLTFKSAGFDVAPFASPLPPELGYREQVALIFREYGGLIAYFLQGRLALGS
ncbi:YdcF family protein [Leptothermofonsia sp. ETS-13]|uniref:YdcF family protein n=1 Tax=Leptothermofonsia sp. ETS-13 TaxID=3035696 RepID=UPI003BA1E867